MKKRGWIALLCGLLAVCPAMADQTDGVVRVGEVTYDVQTVQNSLNAGYQLYESSGISLSAAQKQQLADSVLERFVGLGVLENQLRKEGQAEIDEQTRQALEDYRMPELDYFLTHFLPAFSCTLDQLQAFEAGQG